MSINIYLPQIVYNETTLSFLHWTDDARWIYSGSKETVRVNVF